MNSRHPVQAVLLDLDGTLIDAFGPIIYALNRTLAEFGLAPMSDVEVRRHTGRGECSMISLFGDHREAATRRFLEFHDERLFDVRPMTGAEALLQWLNARGIPTGIVTSKSQERAERQLAHLGWQPWVQAIIGMREGRRQKPDPHTVHLACDTLGVAPARAVMIGDGTADMKAAARAGALPVGLCQDFSEDELTAAGAACCFHTLPQVQQWLSTQIS